MRGQPFINNDFSGGVNKVAAPYAVDANQARDLLNMTGTLIGSAKKRNGFWTLAHPTRAPKSLVTYERGSRYVLVFGDNGTTTSIQSMTIAGSLTDITGAAAYTAGEKWDGVQAPVSGGQGPIYMMNSVDPPLYWAGPGNDVQTWTASAGTVPNGKYIIYHDNRVICAGVATDFTTRSTLYSSGIADPRQWSSPSAVTTLLDPDDGQEITGLGTVGPYVLAFKARKIFVITDTETLFYRNLSDNKGCIAHRTIVASPTGTFFLSGDRTICVTDGSSVETVSDAVQPILAQIPSSMLEHACATFADDKYYISFSTGGDENDTILEFDTRNGSWWPHQIQSTSSVVEAVNDWAILDPSGDVTLIAAGSLDNSPRMYEAFKEGVFVDRGNIDATHNYDSYWVPGWQAYQQPNLRKIVTQVRADHKGSLSFQYAKSFQTGYTEQDGIAWETSEAETTTFGGSDSYGGGGLYGDVSPIIESRYYTLGSARSWSYKFLNSNNTYFELYNYTVGVEMRAD